jgi:hypothetical protein
MRIIVPNIRTVLCQAPSSSAYKSHGVSAAVFLAVEAPESEEEESESDAVHCFFYVFLFYLFFLSAVTTTTNTRNRWSMWLCNSARAALPTCSE